jgi:RNA-directed DNA polymerase
MAKSYRNLWPAIVSWPNLVGSYQKCRRRKRYKPEAAEFDYAWETNLLLLKQDLEDGSYRPGRYRHFFIFEPKRRKISAAPFRDRVVHHAVVRVLEPIFERRFIFDSYACRRGKGTHRALDRAQGYLRRYPYYLKTDIVRFFPNVDHQVLLSVLSRHIADERAMRLIERIVASGDGILRDEATTDYFRGDDLFAALRPKGLPIGNLTSQFFANVLLDVIDHFIKERLGVPGYVRYADDFVLFGDSKQQLWQWCDAVREQLVALRLRLHPDKTQVRPCRLGLRFLGCNLHRDGRRLPREVLHRFSRRIRCWRWLKKQGSLSLGDVRGSLKSWLPYACGANSTGIRREMWKRLRF